jgi:hypothetical protein
VNAAGFNPQDQEEDVIIWTRTPSGSYSAKSAYELQFEGNVASTFPSNVKEVRALSKYTPSILFLLSSLNF